MKGVFVDFGDAGAEEAADEEFEALKLSLDDDEGEVGFGVHVASHGLDSLYLGLDSIVDPLKESILWPSEDLEGQSDEIRYRIRSSGFDF